MHLGKANLNSLADDSDGLMCEVVDSQKAQAGERRQLLVM